MNQNRIYLDHNATTAVSVGVLNQISKILSAWGNPSSIHWAGRDAKQWIRGSRQTLSTILGVSPLEVIFNSGGSEGNNTVIRGIFELLKSKNELLKNKKNHFVTSQVEHPSVLKTFRYLEEQGAKVDYVPVKKNG